MPIEFHCEHCNKIIRASEAEAGQMGKCPHCKGRNYIPRSIGDDAGEIPLAPLDMAEERRRERSAAEDAAIQMKLLRDKARDRDAAGPKPFKRIDVPGPGSGTPPAADRPSKKHLAGAIVSFIEAMSTGNLDKAEKLTAQLLEDRRSAATVIDEMMSEDLSAYGLPPLPRPVLIGFLKQLRGRL